MSWLCKIIGHDWQRTVVSFPDADTKRTQKFPVSHCKRCGEPNPAFQGGDEYNLSFKKHETFTVVHMEEREGHENDVIGLIERKVTGEELAQLTKEKENYLVGFVLKEKKDEE